MKYLLYGHFIYGSKGEDSLTRFKKRNGFVSIDLPRYYVPLTLKGNIALRFGLHRDLKDFMPMWLRRPLIDIRRKWYGNELDAD